MLYQNGDPKVSICAGLLCSYPYSYTLLHGIYVVVVVVLIE